MVHTWLQNHSAGNVAFEGIVPIEEVMRQQSHFLDFQEM